MKIVENIPTIRIAGQQIRLTKLSDDKFDGKHPNNIIEGYTREGKCVHDITIGDSINIIGRGLSDWFLTSAVTKIVNQNTVKTKNSTYQITLL